MVRKVGQIIARGDRKQVNPGSSNRWSVRLSMPFEVVDNAVEVTERGAGNGSCRVVREQEHLRLCHDGSSRSARKALSPL